MPALSNVYETVPPGWISASRDPHAWLAPVTRWTKSGPLTNVTFEPTATCAIVGPKAHGISLIWFVASTLVVFGMSKPW